MPNVQSKNYLETIKGKSYLISHEGQALRGVRLQTQWEEILSEVTFHLSHTCAFNFHTYFVVEPLIRTGKVARILSIMTTSNTVSGCN